MDPTTLDFGTVTVGTRLRKAVTVRNDGTENLTSGIITLAGTNPDQFRRPGTKDLCSGQTLAPAGTCTVAVKFAPSNVGPQSAILVIPSNDFNENPLSLPLSGMGTP